MVRTGNQIMPKEYEYLVEFRGRACSGKHHTLVFEWQGYAKDSMHATQRAFESMTEQKGSSPDRFWTNYYADTLRLQ